MFSPTAQKVAELIRQSAHILLLTDERIDGDTTGSTLGLFHVLTAMGKKVDVFAPKAIPDTFAFLPMVNVIKSDPSIFARGDFDLVIICDCSDGVYVQKLLPNMPRRVSLVVFDHHKTNPRYGTHNVIEEKAASTADVVWRFVREAQLPVDRDAAQCFLTGICTDTVLFSTSNTTEASVEAASELSALGGQLKTIAEQALLHKSIPALRLWGVAMSRLFHDDVFNATATVIVTEDKERSGASEADMEGIGGFVSGFLSASLDESHSLFVVYRETEDGSVKGSTRSRGRDVAKLVADLYGGGGHKLAAGFKVPHARMEERDGKWLLVKKTA